MTEEINTSDPTDKMVKIFGSIAGVLRPIKTDADGNLYVTLNAGTGLTLGVIDLDSISLAGMDAQPNTVYNARDKNNNPIYFNNRPSLFNGTTYDRQHNNIDIALLASAVRAATWLSNPIVNYNSRGILLYLRVTAVPGVDTVRVAIRVDDPSIATNHYLYTFPTVVATGTYLYSIYPGLIAAVAPMTSNVNGILPRVFYVEVTHSAATNFTYSLGASLIL